MKVFKLKSSPDDNPVFGNWSVRFQKFEITNEPDIYPETQTMQDRNYREAEPWELVSVKMIIER